MARESRCLAASWVMATVNFRTVDRVLGPGTRPEMAGRLALRGIIEHPDLELVGVLVHNPDKAGKDAGELCGLPPVGVRATNDPGEILALKPDAVSYMATGDLRPGEAVDDLCRVLEAGINVIRIHLRRFSASPDAVLPLVEEATRRFEEFRTLTA